MVKEIPMKVWHCPYCKKTYTTLSSAESCAKECVQIETPEEDTITHYVCKYCKKNYKEREEKAEKCERKHEENEDKYFHRWADIQNKIKLLFASEFCTTQKRLSEFGFPKITSDLTTLCEEGAIKLCSHCSKCGNCYMQIGVSLGDEINGRAK